MKRLILLWIVFSLLPGSAYAAYESLGKHEDVPFVDGDILVPSGCVRQDSPANSTSADGDYSSIKCDTTGRLWVSGVVTGSLPAGGNAIGSVSVTSETPGTGSTNLGKAENQTYVTSDTGVALLCVRHDTSTTGLAANGNYANCVVNANGAVYTVDDTEMPAAAVLADATANPTVPGVAAFMMCWTGTVWNRCLPGLSDTDDNSVAFSQLTSLSISETHVSDGASWVRWRTYLEDVASVGGEQLVLAGAVREDTPAGSTSATGDYTYLKSDSAGRLWVNCGVGCAAGATTPTDAFANPTTAALNMTFNMGWNGATWDRLLVDGSKFLKVNCATGCAGGATTPSDAFANPTTAGLQMDFNMGWNGATWDRLQVDASKFLKVNCATGCAGGASTPADAFANPTTAGLQMNFNMGWNGTTWDRLKSTTANGLMTDVSRVQAMPGTVVEDAAETAGGTGLFVLSVRRDTPTTSSNASGDNSTFNTSSVGALYTQNIAGPAGGATPCYLTSAASTNATNCKASAGTLYSVSAVNTTATLYYLRLYNSAAAPTCSSATGFIETIPVPAATSGAGIVRDISVGDAYGTGIGFCLTGGGASTDNTNAATGVYLSLHYN